MAISFFDPWSLTSLNLGMYPNSKPQLPYNYGPVDNTPAPPTVWGKPINVITPQKGINPGWVQPRQLVTTSPIQNQYNWGNYNPTQSPIRPWGLQEMYKPLTSNDLLSIIKQTTVPTAPQVKTPVPTKTVAPTAILKR